MISHARAGSSAVLPELSWGAHICHLYRSAEDLAGAVVPYVRAGLERDERCLWIACAEVPAEAALAALRRVVPDVDERVTRGQLEVLERDAWCAAGARPTPEQALAECLERERLALDEGYPGLRIAGDAPCPHGAFRERRIVTLCGYSLERCGPTEVVDVLRDHAFAVLRRNGGWEVLRSATSALASAITSGREHGLHLYEAGAPACGARVIDWIADGVLGGEAALVVASARSRAAVRDGLVARGVQPSLLQRAGLLVERDVDELLEKVAPRGAFSAQAFSEHVEPLVRAMTRDAPNVRMFGEMVDRLWQRGRPEDALRLERSWSAFRAGVPFGLACSFKVSPRTSDEEALLIRLRSGDDETHGCRALGHPGTSRGMEVLTSQLARHQRVTSLLAEAVALADVRRIVLSEMPHAVGAEEAVLGLAIDAGARLALAGAGAAERIIERGAAHPLAAAFRDGAPISARDWETIDLERPGPTDGVTCLPLVAMGEPLGAIGFGFRRSAPHTASDRALLLDLARQTACALLRARLYDAARAGRDRLALLADATARIASAKLDLEGILEALVGEVTRAFADACVVSLVQRHGDPPIDAVAGAPLSADEVLVERVLGTAKAELVAGGSSPRSLLVVPLRASGDVLGVITAARDRPDGRFAAEDQALLQDLADRAGLAVQNALLFREVERGRRTADEANRAKDDFLAVLGHELRNPLSPIATALHLMELRGGHVLARERQVIERQVRHMTALVDDLLDLARVTRGKLELKRSRVDLSDVVAKAVEMASPLLEARAQHLTVEVAPGHVVDGDARRLAQVVANLLSNAAKYTPPRGHIRVTAAREGAELTLAVQDDGIGIEPALLPRIFLSFVQAPRANDRAEGGLGIGLTIVQRLVELHGGSVSAASEGPGTGCTLTVRLPAPAATDDDPPPLDPLESLYGSTRRRLLVVDDNRDAAEMLGTALRLLGHDVREAFDGPQALDLLARFSPDLAFLDIGLPVMDGYELAGRIHALEGLAGVPLVAVTGYGQDWDRARSKFAGFAEHLVKPVNISALTTLIETLTADA